MKRKQENAVEAAAKRSKLPDGTVGAGNGDAKGHLYRAPTGDEMTAIRETGQSFRSNLFRLQVSELLGEVSTKARYSALDKALGLVKKHLEGLPDVDSFKLSEESSWLPEGVKFPLPKELLGGCTKDATFSFSAPSAIKVVGSYLLGTLAKPELNVDLAVQIPTALLDAGDHLNHRYTHKRAAYLCYLAHHLGECSAVARVDFACLHSRLMPVLAVSLAGKAGRQFTLRVHPVVDESAFKPIRLGPARNCLRWKKFYRAAADPESDDPATPYYNTLLLRDMALNRHLALLHAAFQQCPAMADAIRLLKVWLRQRSLDKGLSGFSGFLGSMLAVHLLDTSRISKTMSSYQILRMILTTLGVTLSDGMKKPSLDFGLMAGTVDWTKKGTFMHKDDSTPSAADFHRSFEVVFVDNTGYLNLTAHMTEASYCELVHEAKLALGCLHAHTGDAFEALFMVPIKFSHKFDQVIQLSDVAALKRPGVKAWQQRCLAAGGDWLASAERYAGRVLRRGLAERASLVSIRCNSKLQWSVAKPAVKLQSATMSVGLLLDHAAAFSVVEQGPSADAPEADDFRAFWGKKSELRRFRDTSILEAVVWKSDSMAEKRTIPMRIVTHLLERHMSVDAASVCDVTQPYDAVLQPAPVTRTSAVQLPDGDDAAAADHADSDVIPKNSQQARILLAAEKAKVAKSSKKQKKMFAGTGEEETAKIMSSFEYLARQLRAIEGLSLDIISVQGASPLFRNTDVFPSMAGVRCEGAKSLTVATPHGKKSANWRSSVLLPGAVRSPPWSDVFDIVCHLEGSGSWPDDVDAIARVKASFFVQLSAMLEQKHSLTAVPTASHLLVAVNGFLFRLSIAHAFELALLERSAEEVQSVGAATPPSSLTSGPGHSELQRHTVALPLHTSRMHSVSQQFLAFSMTCRLAKRWAASQLLSRFFCDETVELIVAHLFLHPGAFQPPGSGVSGLLRFLSLLVNFDWSGQPLIVNIASDLSDEAIDQLTSSFQTRRQNLPAMVIFTPDDKNSIWTSQRCPVLALRRCQVLAQQSMAVLDSQVMASTLVSDYQSLFRPSLDDYHVLIHLRPRHVPRLYQALSTTQAQNVEGEDVSAGSLQLPVAGFDPVSLYLQQLEAAYGHVALFFYDRYGGTTIGVVWTLHSAETPTFKIATASGFCPVADAGKAKKTKASSGADSAVQTVCFNKAAALDDFRILGAGLVRQVQVPDDDVTSGS